MISGLKDDGFLIECQFNARARVRLRKLRIPLDLGSELAVVGEVHCADLAGRICILEAFLLRFAPFVDLLAFL